MKHYYIIYPTAETNWIYKIWISTPKSVSKQIWNLHQNKPISSEMNWHPFLNNIANSFSYCNIEIITHSFPLLERNIPTIIAFQTRLIPEIILLCPSITACMHTLKF